LHDAGRGGLTVPSRLRSPRRQLRVGLVGCGQIADAHLQEISRIEGAVITAVCDREEDLARQAAVRFGIGRYFTDLGRLLAETRVDVLHITTPPQSHCELTIEALDAGAHVYVEKPFAANASEARQMLAAAERCDRLICAGHDQLWDPAWTEFRHRAEREIGALVHAEVLQRYDLSGPFGKRVTADPDHWVRLLDGGLPHNAIPHSVYRLASLLPRQEPVVSAVWFARSAGFSTDLHVFVKTGRVTGTLTFVTGARPPGSLVRVYGDAGALELDCDTHVIRRQRDSRLPALLACIHVPAAHAREGAKNVLRSMRQLARGDLRFFSGMGTLIRAFYVAIDTGGAPPVPYPDVERTVCLMDRIFETCGRSSPPQELDNRSPCTTSAVAQS
jgi:predicted dehydrogenase